MKYDGHPHFELCILLFSPCKLCKISASCAFDPIIALLSIAQQQEYFPAQAPIQTPTHWSHARPASPFVIPAFIRHALRLVFHMPLYKPHIHWPIAKTNSGKISVQAVEVIVGGYAILKIFAFFTFSISNQFPWRSHFILLTKRWPSPGHTKITIL